MCVGNKVKQYLAQEKITQTEISKKTGIPLPKLNLALNGKRKLTFEEYETICGAIHVGADKFLTPRIYQENSSQQ